MFLFYSHSCVSEMLQLPLVVTAQVDLLLVLVSLLAFWTRLSHLNYPNAVVWVDLFHTPEHHVHPHTNLRTKLHSVINWFFIPWPLCRFDEVYYGQFVSLYMKRVFFIDDSGPPLGHMILASGGGLLKYQHSPLWVYSFIYTLLQHVLLLLLF